jgi:hypothetical protein
MVMIGALRQPSITSASGKPGSRVVPLSQTKDLSFAPPLLSAGMFESKS